MAGFGRVEREVEILKQTYDITSVVMGDGGTGDLPLYALQRGCPWGLQAMSGCLHAM
jgi:hypothetical protein